MGCVCGDLGLGDPRQGTWGHQVWDPGTCGTGTQEVKYRDAGMRMITAKVEGKCDISHFPCEYVLARAIMGQRGNLRALAGMCEF